MGAERLSGHERRYRTLEAQHPSPHLRASGPPGAAPGGEVLAVVAHQAVVRRTEAGLGVADRGLGAQPLGIGPHPHPRARRELLERGPRDTQSPPRPDVVDDRSVTTVDPVVAVPEATARVEVITA